MATARINPHWLLHNLTNRCVTVEMMLTYIIRGKQAIGEAARGLAPFVIDPIRRKIRPNEGGQEVVVAGINCGIPEHHQSRKQSRRVLRRHSRGLGIITHHRTRTGEVEVANSQCSCIAQSQNHNNAHTRQLLMPTKHWFRHSSSLLYSANKSRLLSVTTGSGKAHIGPRSGHVRVCSHPYIERDRPLLSSGKSGFI